jgi:cobalamin-dependent methionine synthase I
MAVTAGPKIIQAIRALEKDDLKLGVIYDASASEIVDAGFDWIQNYYNQELARESRYLLGKRISCGYRDFSLKYQDIFYKLLNLERLGITMTKAYMLVPEKSATAVTAIAVKTQ